MDEKSSVVPARPGDLSYEGDTLEKPGILESSRTMLMMQLLERKGMLAKDMAKDNLLPSAQLFAGYRRYGTDYTMNDPQYRVYGGISSSVNFGRQQQKAASKTAKIDLYKTRMQNKSSLLTFKSDIDTLKREINREKELIEVTDRKLELVERVLRAERQNYLIGKTSLNDLIMHMNNAAQIRYDAIYHRVLYRQLVIEWKRLTDVLVSKSDLQ